MRILLTGVSGQLGRHLLWRGKPDSSTLITSGRSAGDAPCDLTDRAGVDDLLARTRPDLIVNAAAWTAVDQAEEHAEQAFLLNSELPQWLAQWAYANDAGLLTYSTDYVFDGQPGRGWREDDACAPQSVYGQSKWAGEQALLSSRARVLIVRTAWVFSALPGNFLSAIIARAMSGHDLRVVDDQIGSPTWAGTLAEASWGLAGRLAEITRPALVHVAGSSAMSWYDFARRAVDQAVERGVLARPVEVVPIKSSQWPQKARRPTWSVLDCSRYRCWSGQKLAPVDEVLRECFEQWTIARC